MHKLIAVLILGAVSLWASEPELHLHWSFNRTNNLFTFRYESKTNHFYTIVRHDIDHDYGDSVHHNARASNATVIVEVDPKVCCDPEGDLNPNPSDNLQFYLVDATFGEMQALQRESALPALEALDCFAVSVISRPTPP